MDHTVIGRNVNIAGRLSGSGKTQASTFDDEAWLGTPTPAAKPQGKFMGHTATWKILEELMLELRKRGAILPPNIINDLRSAKLMINISEFAGAKGDSTIRVDEYLGNFESILLSLPIVRVSCAAIVPKPGTQQTPSISP